MKRAIALWACLTLSPLLACADSKSASGRGDGGSESKARPASVASSSPVPPASAATPAAATPSQLLAQRLAGSILVGGHAMDYLRDLTDAGPRLTGSPGYAHAAAWAAEAFRRAGIDQVALEDFTIDTSWQKGDATATATLAGAGAGEPPLSLHVTPMAWTPPGPAGGIKGELVYLDALTPDTVKAKKDTLKGKIVLVEREGLFKDGKVVSGRAIDPLKDAGVLAIALVGRQPSNVPIRHGNFGYRVSAIPLPGFDLGREDGLLLKRLVEKGPVTVTFTNASVLGGPVSMPNVIAELRGSEKPDEWVMVSAHLDCWDFATGAQDNGSGVAEVLEAARAIRALGAPKRSMRFALWGGEEQGLLGSSAYVKAHAAELDRAVMLVNTDYGAGAPEGWDLDGRDDVEKAMKPLAKELLAGLGGDALQTQMRCDTDHCPFWLAGVPTANLDVDGSKYMEIHHLPSDTIDKVNEAWIAEGAAVVAVTAYAVANAPERIAPRVDRANVAARLKKAGMLDELTYEGAWKP